MARRAEATFRTTTRRWALVVAALALAAPGCKTWHSFKDRTNTIRTALLDSGYDDPRTPEKLTNADQLFTDGNYPKAQDLYRDLADNRNNSLDLSEYARFMLAECRFARGQYPEAVDTYHKLLMDFPTGAHRRESCARMFEIADFWLNDFRDELEKRKNENGVLGWRPAWKSPFDKTRPLFGQEGRTLEALEHVWTHDMMGPLADKSLFWCGYVNYIRGNFQEADHFFSTLVEVHKESPLRAAGDGLRDPVEKQRDRRRIRWPQVRRRQLVHVAEATVPELTQDPAMTEKLTRSEVRHSEPAGREGLPHGAVLRAHRAPRLRGVLLRARAAALRGHAVLRHRYRAEGVAPRADEGGQAAAGHRPARPGEGEVEGTVRELRRRGAYPRCGGEGQFNARRCAPRFAPRP